MKIEKYEFGSIVIDDRKYVGDVVILEQYVDSNWRRESGHNLTAKDIAQFVSRKPDVFIIGTGNSGRMKVPPETREFILSKGVDLRVDKTDRACELYNEMSKDRHVIAALHLTC